jgi:hypothetical protein
VGAGSGSLAACDDILKALRLRPALPPRMCGILRRYINDSILALREVARVLAPSGRAVFVIGENTIRRTFIPTGTLLSYTARTVGLRLVSKRLRTLPGNRRYLPPPEIAGEKLDTRMRREAILTFEHAACL